MCAEHRPMTTRRGETNPRFEDGVLGRVDEELVPERDLSGLGLGRGVGEEAVDTSRSVGEEVARDVHGLHVLRERERERRAGGEGEVLFDLEEGLQRGLRRGHGVVVELRRGDGLARDGDSAVRCEGRVTRDGHQDRVSSVAHQDATRGLHVEGGGPVGRARADEDGASGEVCHLADGDCLAVVSVPEASLAAVTTPSFRSRVRIQPMSDSSGGVSVNQPCGPALAGLPLTEPGALLRRP